MSAAFFDPSTSKSKFIFSDGTVLGFNFELGSEFDKPVVTDLGTELKKYGISTLQNGVTAALTLMASQELVFFKGQTYCKFSYAKGSSGSDCLLKPSAEFFRCDSIKRTPGNCAAPSSLSGTVTDAQPIKVSVNSGQKGITDVANVRTGDETNSTTQTPLESGGSGRADSVYSLPIVHTLCQLTLNFLLFSFIKTLL